MTPEDARKIIKEEVQRYASQKRFQQATLPRHIHNGTDSPPVFNPTRVYTGYVPADADIASADFKMFPRGWTVTLEAGPIYKITHNLGTEFYSVTACQTGNPVQQIFPATALLTDTYVEVYWLNTSLSSVASAFHFTLTTISNKDALFTSYIQ